jgi:hypothetical protein
MNSGCAQRGPVDIGRCSSACRTAWSAEPRSRKPLRFYALARHGAAPPAAGVSTTAGTAGCARPGNRRRAWRCAWT